MAVRGRRMRPLGVHVYVFYGKVKFGNLGFSIGKSETIEACDLKVGRYRQLIDFMKECEY